MNTDQVLGSVELCNSLFGSHDRIFPICGCCGTRYEFDDIGWWIFRRSSVGNIPPRSTPRDDMSLSRKCPGLFHGTLWKSRYAKKILSIFLSWSERTCLARETNTQKLILVYCGWKISQPPPSVHPLYCLSKQDGRCPFLDSKYIWIITLGCVYSSCLSFCCRKL